MELCHVQWRTALTIGPSINIFQSDVVCFILFRPLDIKSSLHIFRMVLCFQVLFYIDNNIKKKKKKDFIFLSPLKKSLTQFFALLVAYAEDVAVG